ncbi:MAG: hypothetical protein IKN39_00940 [Clostridia bacterium]|nr:hypothetical protein [Clostridia bacterium]
MADSNVYSEPQETDDTAVTESGENQTLTGQGNATISVKFNKEIKNLTAIEAANLAQKGMKFELIENDFSKLKDLAGKHNLSVPEYIRVLENEQADKHRQELLDQCGGNEQLADRVLELENGQKNDDSLEELKEFFPTIKSIDDLPRAVVESARLKNESLLNSYLKYRIVKRRRQREEDLFERDTNNASIGSQKSTTVSGDDAFLRALWGR